MAGTNKSQHDLWVRVCELDIANIRLSRLHFPQFQTNIPNAIKTLPGHEANVGAGGADTTLSTLAVVVVDEVALVFGVVAVAFRDAA